MKRVRVVAALCMVPIALMAQEPVVESGVRHLTLSVKGAPVGLLVGSTTTLSHIVVDVVTVRPKERIAALAPGDAAERLVIVKDGTMRTTVNGHHRSLGRA